MAFKVAEYLKNRVMFLIIRLKRYSFIVFRLNIIIKSSQILSYNMNLEKI